MNTAQVRNAYAQSESQAKIHPVKLIYMMYERLLVHLDLTRKAMADDDLKGRGENLGKAIALLTELSASIKEDDDSEAAQFLRGLYSAILTELPKVAVDSNVQVVKQCTLYVSRLKEIWEETAMQEYEQAHPKVVEVVKPKAQVNDYRAGQGADVQGVSVSI